MKPAIIAACAGLALSTSSALAGDLNPPPGPVAPTMKPLDALLPGTCIEDLPTDEGASRIISQPGSYVLTQDLLGEQGKDGLRVNCDAFPAGEHHVHINLQGHTLRGVPGAANAIFVHNSNPSLRTVHITISGAVRDAAGNPSPGSLITGWSIDGVHVENATSVSLHSIRVSSCGGDGFESKAPASNPKAMRAKCFTSTFSDCGGDGVHIEDADSIELRNVDVDSCVGDGFESWNPPNTGSSVSTYTCKFRTCGGNGVLVTLPATGINELEMQEVSSVDNALHGARFLYAATGTSPTPRSRIRAHSVHLARNAQGGLYISGNPEESISYSFDIMSMADNGGDGGRISLDAGGLTLDVSIDWASCAASGNAGDGFSFRLVNAGIDSGNNINWDFCSSSSNTGDGFSVVCPNSVPVRCGLRNSSSSGNSGHGLRAQSCDLHVSVCHLIANGGSGADVTGSSGLRRASIDRSRCDDNADEGIHADGLSSLHVSSSSCASNGRGTGNGGGLYCGNTDHFVCDSSSFLDNASHGISVLNTDNLYISDTNNNRNGTGPTGGDGLHADNVLLCECDHLIANGNTGHGASLTQCASVSIASSSFSSNDSDGLACTNGGGIRIHETSCRDNTDDGARLSSCARVTISSSCVFELNGDDGVHSDGDSFVMCDTYVGANGGNGVSVTTLLSSSIQRCVSSDNGGHGTWYPDCDSDGTFDDCTFANNGGDGLHVSDFGLSRVVEVTRCVCPGNTGNGITVTNNLGLPCGTVSLDSCSTSRNGASGIAMDCSTGGSVRRCVASDNGNIGILVATNNHVVVENMCSSNPGGNLICPTPGNSLGPLTNEAAMPQNTNPAANYVR